MPYYFRKGLQQYRRCTPLLALPFASAPSLRCCIIWSSSQRRLLGTIRRPQSCCTSGRVPLLGTVPAEVVAKAAAMTAGRERQLHCCRLERVHHHPPILLRQDGYCGDGGRHMSTAGGQSMGNNVASSSSLQELLGISDLEVMSMRDRHSISNSALDNLIKSSGDGGDSEHNRHEKSVPGITCDNYDPSRLSGSFRPASCFPRFLLDELHAKPTDVKSLVLRRPVVLGWSDCASREVARWLRESLAMRRFEVAQLLVRHPEAGTKSVESIECKVKWLQNNLDLSDTNDRGVVRLLLLAPSVLGLSIERSLEPTLRWLNDRVDLSREEAARVVRGNPNVFQLSLEGNLEPTLGWLRRRLKDQSIVRTMVTQAPNILSMNVDSGIEPKLRWLQDGVGLTPQEVCELIGREPAILYKSVSQNLDPTLTWLRKHLNLDKRAAREMIVAYPRLLSTSIGKNLSLKLPWLQQSLGLRASEAIALAQRAPQILQYSIENNLVPKVAFFREEMHATTEELKESVLRNPKVFAYSLDRRFRPRVAAMKRVKLEPRFSEHQANVCLWSDSKFQGFIERY